MNDRTCIVTRESGPADNLIRFVAGPDGTVVPDLKRVLPGRGCWVTARHSLVEKASAKNLFARALKANVRPPDDLADLVEALLARALLGSLGLARKAGQVVAGSAKVDSVIRSGKARLVLHATDASDDGVRKLAQARHAAGAEDRGQVPALRFFTGEELDSALGADGVKHVAVLAGTAGEGVVKRAMILDRYRDGPRTAPAGRGSRSPDTSQYDRTVGTAREETDTE